MKKNKGFTLIELLAVIVILAVIALISSPLIMGTIRKAKMNSLKDSAYGILKAAENYQAEELMNTEGEVKPLVIKNIESDTTLLYKGKKPKCGYAVIDSDISTIVISDGQYIARKGYTDKDIKTSKGTCFDVQKELESISTPVQDGLQVYYDGTKAPVLENGKLLWKDQSGNGRDGEMINFTGKNYYQNHSIIFDETEHIRIGEMNYEKVTLEMTTSIQKDSTNQMTLLANYELGGYGFRAYSNYIDFSFYLDGHDYIIDLPKYQEQRNWKKFTLGKQYYLAGTYDKETHHYYQNEEHAKLSVPGSIGTTKIHSIMMVGANPGGNQPEGNFLVGTVSSVRIYNRALTEEEIKHNYIVDKLKYEF